MVQKVLVNNLIQNKKNAYIGIFCPVLSVFFIAFVLVIRNKSPPQNCKVSQINNFGGKK